MHVKKFLLFIPPQAFDEHLICFEKFHLAPIICSLSNVQQKHTFQPWRLLLNAMDTLPEIHSISWCGREGQLRVLPFH
jgi:hypothetical protein